MYFVYQYHLKDTTYALLLLVAALEYFDALDSFNQARKSHYCVTFCARFTKFLMILLASVRTTCVHPI